jgi:hypothetical protein
MVGFGCFAFIARRMERLAAGKANQATEHSSNFLTPSSMSRVNEGGDESDPALRNYTRDEQITILISQVKVNINTCGLP